MGRTWTFGRKLAAGFMSIAVLVIVISGVAVYALDTVVAAKDEVISRYAQDQVDLEILGAANARKTSSVRGFLLTGDARDLQERSSYAAVFESALARLRERAEGADVSELLAAIGALEDEHRQGLDELVSMRRSEAPLADIIEAFDGEVQPKGETLARRIAEVSALQQRRLEDAKEAASVTASQAANVLIGAATATILLALGIAVVLTRTLGRQIGASVAQIQSSSAELQSAAKQQASGAKEQATAMKEITTTIVELLATSRQIAESARRVTQIADKSVDAARTGGETVDRGQDSVLTIKQQVDLVVTHMLELGKKSQQIGAVLEIVSELAEQTNILAINATIEAAGAGDAGKRFGAVAEEIRKLADRVGGSAKEIRLLIDDVRSAVNGTIMTTESGAKSVELGLQQFSNVASAFNQITKLLGTTTEAAKEIELSTTQQTTAVEQVNLAISNVAQSTKETEASSAQTLQTASELAGLSRELRRLVEPEVV